MLDRCLDEATNHGFTGTATPAAMTWLEHYPEGGII